MAGLLLKELKIRGLVKRTLIVAPANLCFQWQRELKEKFRESFEVVRSDVLRANYGQNPWQEKNQVITSILAGRHTSRHLLSRRFLETAEGSAPTATAVADGPNKVMDAAYTAVGARGVDKPRKRKVPSPTRA
jgi:hypothetical protein